MTTTSTVDKSQAFGRRILIGPYNHSVITQAGNTGTAVSTDTTVGVSNPGWRNQVRRAVNATTPYSRTSTRDGLFYVYLTSRQKRRDPNWAGPARYDDEVTEISGALGNNPRILPPALIASSSLDAQARISFIKQARAMQRSFQGGVFLGELRETIAMIRRPAEALRRSVSAYNRSAWKAVRRENNAKAAAKALSGTWLEYSFGWRPLFSDVDDAMKALAKQGTLEIRVISGFAREKWKSFPVRDTNGLSGFSPVMKRVYQTEYDNFVRYKGAIGFESTNKAPSWRSNWGLTLSDFAPTLWEIFPYSFLVDYFSNIGDVIDSASFGYVSCRWGSKAAVSSATVKTVCDWAISDNPPALTNGRITHGSAFVPTLSNYQFSRTPIAGVSVGVFDVALKVPGLGSNHWLNIAALANEKGIGYRKKR